MTLTPDIPDDAIQAAANAIGEWFGDEPADPRMVVTALDAALPHLRRSQALACQGDTSTGSCSCFTAGQAKGHGDSRRWLIMTAANFGDDKDASAILRKAADLIGVLSSSTEGATSE